MGNKDNWYLLDIIQIPSIFAFNISDVQVFNIFKTYSTRILRIQNVLSMYSTYSTRILYIQNVFNVVVPFGFGSLRESGGNRRGYGLGER